MRVNPDGNYLPLPAGDNVPGTVLPKLLWKESPNQSARTAPIRLVVLHDTEGAYGGAVSWFSQAQSQVSAHVVLREDGLEATQMVPYGRKAWHCAAYNSESVGIEMAGIASKGFASSELRHAARLVAFYCHKFGLPPNHVTPKGPGTAKGWTCHQDLGAAGGGHHDPGFSKVKMLWFAGLVKMEYKRGGFRDQYGRD